MANKNNKTLAKVYHYDLYGKRQDKYDFLNQNSVADIHWNELDYKEPYFFFVPKDFEAETGYMKGFKIDTLFQINNSGVSTDRDTLFLDTNPQMLSEKIKVLLSGEYDIKFKEQYNVKDSSGFPLLKRISNKKYSSDLIIDYHYRPFDVRKIYFDKTIISRPAKKITEHFNHKNIFLIVPRQVNKSFHHVFVSRLICDSNITSSARLFGAGKLFPLYLYRVSNKQKSLEQGNERDSNLNTKVVQQIADSLGLDFVAEKDYNSSDDFESSDEWQTFAPIDILDYIYAVLHSPTYREKYKEFLKIDFPRVPYPKDKESFWQLASLGSELRQIHLLESPKTEQYITGYPIDGDNKITRKITKKDWELTSQGATQSRTLTEQAFGRIWINDTQYFENIPLVAWEFYIGGYQPAQKWLKDRAPKKGQPGRTLSYDDILHYQKIIVALTETDRLMGEIDKIGIE